MISCCKDIDKTSKAMIRTVRNTKVKCCTSLPETPVKAETTTNRLGRKRDWFAEGHPRITGLIKDPTIGPDHLSHYITTMFSKTYKCSK